MQNSIKHSGCSKIFVQLYDYEDYLHLCIEDNGKGYDENLVSKGKGLNNILYRVLALNGKIQTESNFDNGTFVSVTIPLLKDEND